MFEDPLDPIVTWRVPAVAPGQTTVSHLTLEATAKGNTVLSTEISYSGATIEAGGEGLLCTDGCTRDIPLRAVAAGSARGGVDGLARTGPTLPPMLVLTIVLLLIGASGLRLGRVPTPACVDALVSNWAPEPRRSSSRTR